MPLSVPTELKKITPFIRRAEELDRDRSSPESRLVAYYCRQYAVSLGIPAAASSTDSKACLGNILETLEQEKAAMNQFTRDEAAFVSRSFANRVFDKADTEDRAGQATKETAKAFYAAASFLQILEQFFDENDTSEEVVEDKKKIKYAKWKAMEIHKAFKEGRTPTPGGYGESAMEEIIDEPIGTDGSAQQQAKLDAPPTVETVTEDDEDDAGVLPPRISLASPTAPVVPPAVQSPPVDTAPSNEGMEVQMGPPPSYPGEGTSTGQHFIHPTNVQPPPPPMDRPKISFDAPPPMPPPMQAPQPPVAPTHTAQPQLTPTNTGGGFGSMFRTGRKNSGEKVSKAQFSDATELTRFALVALEDKDADLAAERLRQALQALGR